MKNLVESIFRKLNWKSGSSYSIWVLPVVAIEFIALGVTFLNAPTGRKATERICLGKFGISCTDFHRDFALTCFLTASFSLVIAAEIGRILGHPSRATTAMANILKPLRIAHYFSHSAKRFFVDFVSAMTASLLLLTVFSATTSNRIPTWERCEIWVIVCTTFLLLALEIMANRGEIMFRLGDVNREILILTTSAFIIFGHIWAQWTWNQIAVASGIIAAVGALGNWLAPEKPQPKARDGVEAIIPNDEV